MLLISEYFITAFEKVWGPPQKPHSWAFSYLNPALAIPRTEMNYAALYIAFLQKGCFGVRIIFGCLNEVCSSGRHSVVPHTSLVSVFTFHLILLCPRQLMGELMGLACYIIIYIYIYPSFYRQFVSQLLYLGVYYAYPFFHIWPVCRFFSFKPFKMYNNGLSIVLFVHLLLAINLSLFLF